MFKRKALLTESRAVFTLWAVVVGALALFVLQIWAGCDWLKTRIRYGSLHLQCDSRRGGG